MQGSPLVFVIVNFHEKLISQKTFLGYFSAKNPNMTIILAQNPQEKRNFMYSLQVHFLINNACSIKKSCFCESIAQTISFLQYSKLLVKF